MIGTYGGTTALQFLTLPTALKRASRFGMIGAAARGRGTTIQRRKGNYGRKQRNDPLPTLENLSGWDRSLAKPVRAGAWTNARLVAPHRPPLNKSKRNPSAVCF